MNLVDIRVVDNNKMNDGPGIERTRILELMAAMQFAVVSLLSLYKYVGQKEIIFFPMILD